MSVSYRISALSRSGRSIHFRSAFAYNYIVQSSPVTIVFLGTSAFAVPSLRALENDPRFKVCLVITQPDRPSGRKQALTPPPVKTEALKLGIRVLQPEKMNAAYGDMHDAEFRERPDFLVVVSYGQILSQSVLDWPTKAAVNVHASLLPKLRGASPLQHAILRDETETGITVQQMTASLDAGPILGQSSMTLDERETFVHLHDTLANEGAKLLVETLTAPLLPVEQRNDQATFCTKLRKEDGRADPVTMTADTIDRLVRALTPWPGVTVGTDKILATELHETPQSFPLPCKDGTVLHITKIQAAGKKPMSGQDFARGRSSLLRS